MNKSCKNITMSVEFRRTLIMKLKEHPSVWNNSKIKTFNSVERNEAWKTIEREIGLPSECSLEEIQTTWASLSEMYFRLIFLRTIERNFEAPTWLFFHEMSFLYDHVKETIQNMLGGISPPLFKARPMQNESKEPKCPCCLHVRPYQNSQPDISSVEKTDIDDEFKNETSATLETSFENIDNTSVSVESICSLDFEDTENQSKFSTNSPKVPQNKNDSSLAKSPSQDIITDKTFGVIELMDDTEAIKESTNSQLPAASIEYVTGNHPSEDICHPLQERNLIELNSPVETAKLKTSHYINDDLKDKNVTIDQTQSSGLTTNENYSKGNEIKELEAGVNKVRKVSRSQIIEAIKANPNTYLYTPTTKRKLYIAAWNRIAEELGNVPLRGLKNRWKLIKTRYLKELVFERYSNGRLKSSWELFDKLEFLRPYMQKDIDDVHCTRVQMKNAIRNNSSDECCIISNPEPNEIVLEQTSKTCDIKQSVNNKAELPTPAKSCIGYLNGNANIQICTVEPQNKINPIETNCKKPIQLDTPLVLDAKTLPILQNRPIKITAIQILPSLTNKDKKDESNDNIEAQPPAAKKLRTNTNKTNVLATITLPPVPSLTSAEPATSAKPNCVQQKEPQIFPILDLTLDDDDPATAATSAFKNNSTSKFQQDSVDDECIYTCKIFPTLDLTTDEDNEENINGSKNEELIASKSKKRKKSDDDNVICLEDDDDDEMVSIYEEVDLSLDELE